MRNIDVFVVIEPCLLLLTLGDVFTCFLPEKNYAQKYLHILLPLTQFHTRRVYVLSEGFFHTVLRNTLMSFVRCFS